MIRETRELLAALVRVNHEIPDVCLGIMEETLPVAKQVAFGNLLVGLGEAVRVHAQHERAEVVELPPDRVNGNGAATVHELA